MLLWYFQGPTDPATVHAGSGFTGPGGSSAHPGAYQQEYPLRPIRGQEDNAWIQWWFFVFIEGCLTIDDFRITS